MLAALRQVLRRWPRLSDTCRPSDPDLAELGLTRAQAERLAALPAAVPQRMAGMAAIFGLTLAEIEADREDWIALAEICAGCRRVADCRKVLAGGTETAGPARFCRNAESWEAMAGRAGA